MSFFNSKLRYALCASIDLAMQPTNIACQSREIAHRQEIPGPYLDQILASLKSAGIVRSVRGAGGGYTLARSPEKISISEIVQALMRGDKLFAGNFEKLIQELTSTSALTVVREFEEQIETFLTNKLESVTLADLVNKKQTQDDVMSLMPGF